MSFNIVNLISDSTSEVTDIMTKYVSLILHLFYGGHFRSVKYGFHCTDGLTSQLNGTAYFHL